MYDHVLCSVYTLSASKLLPHSSVQIFPFFQYFACMGIFPISIFKEFNCTKSWFSTWVWLMSSLSAESSNADHRRLLPSAFTCFDPVQKIYGCRLRGRFLTNIKTYPNSMTNCTYCPKKCTHCGCCSAC